MSYLADYIKKSLQNTPATSSSESGNEHNTQKSKKSAPSTLSELIQQSMGHRNSSINYDRVDDYNHGVDVLNYTLDSWNKWYDASRSGLEGVGFGAAGDASAAINDESASMLERLGQSRKWAQDNKELLGDDYDSVMDSLQQATTATYWMNKGYEGKVEHFGQWGSQEEYDQYQADVAQRAEAEYYNTPGALADAYDAWKKIGDARAAYDDLDEIKRYQMAGYGTVPEEEREALRAQHEQRLAEITETYGVTSPYDLMDLIYRMEEEYGQLQGKISDAETYQAGTAQNSKIAGWNMKYGGMDYGQLKQVMESATDPEEKAWLQSFAETKMTAADYDAEIATAQTRMEELDSSLEEYRAQYEYWERLVAQYSQSGDPEDWAKLGEAQENMNSYLELITQTEAEKQATGERQWQLEQDRKYAVLDERADFDERSAVTADEMTSGFGIGIGKNIWLGKGDAVYDYINFLDGSPEAHEARNESKGRSSYSVYDRMTDDERKRYNYLYNTEGRDAATEYLKYLEPELDKRVSMEASEQMAALAESHPLFADALNIPLTLTSGIGYLDIAAQNAIRKLTGSYQPVNYYSPFMNLAHESIAISKTRVKNITDKYGVIDLDPEDHPYLAPILNGRGLADVYQLGMSAINSKVASLTGNPVLATTLLASSAATQGVLDALERGATDEQALTMGLWNGVFEALFEFWEVDELLKGKPSWVKAAVNQAITEGVGEGATSIANNIADGIIMADKSALQQAAAEYMDNEGLSYEDAYRKAFADMMVDIGWDIVGGAASGAMSVGGMAAGNAVMNQVQYAALPQTVKNSAERLQGFGMDKGAATDISIALYQGAEDYGKAAGAYMAAFDPKQDPYTYASDFRQAYEIGKNNGNREYLGKLSLNEDQKKIAYELGAAASRKASQEAKAQADSDGDRTYGVSDDGSTIDSTGKAVKVKGFASVGDKAVLELEDGKNVDAKEVSFGTADEAILYETIAQVTGSAETANRILNSYSSVSGEVSASDFAAGLRQAYDLGVSGQVAERQLGTYELVGKLPAAVRSAAFNRGKTVGDYMATAGQATREARGRQVKGQRQGQLHFDRKGRTFDSKREFALKAMEALSKALGIDIYVYESYVEGGKRVYQGRTWDKESAPNGFYDKDGIHIDLNAGNFGQGTMMFTVAHELTHFIKEWSPVKFRKLADILVNRYAEQGVSVRELIDRQIAKAKENGREIDRDTAFEEVVADSMETMLTQGDIGDFMAQLSQKDKTLRDKIREWFRNLADSLKAVADEYRGAKPESPEGRLVAQMDDFVKVLQQAYAEALVEAGENYRANEGKKNTTLEGGVKYQARPTDKDTVHIKEMIKAASNDLNAMDPVADVSTVDLTKMNTNQRYKWAVSILKATGYKIDRQNFGVIEFSEKQINTGMNYLNDPGEFAAFAALPRVLKRGKIIHDDNNHKFRKFGTVIIAAPVTINGVRGNMGVAIQKTTSTHYHTHRILMPDGSAFEFKINAAPTPSGDLANNAHRATTISTASNDRVTQQKPGVKTEPAKKMSDRSGVEMTREQQINSQQFKAWFDNSKIVNADGSPKVMYHGSQAQFDTFDRKKARSSGTYGKGFYFTNSATHAGTYGNLYAVYLSIQNPVQYGKGSVSKDQVRKFLEAVADNEDYSIENYGTYDIDKILRGVMSGKSKADTFQVIQDISATAVGDMMEAVELFNKVNGTSYDGIVTATETVAFRPTQIKSATDNVGTFDKENPNIYFSDRDPTAAATAQALERQNAKLREDVKELRELVRMQGKLTHGGEFTKSSIEAAMRSLTKTAMAKLDAEGRQQLSGMLKDFYRYIATDKELAWEGVTEKAGQIADFLMDNVTIKPQRDGYADEVLRNLRGARVRLSDSQRAEVEKLYGYENYRKMLFGAGIYLSRDGMSLDSFWNEQASEFPGTFTEDVYDGDQPAELLSIIDAMREGDDSAAMEYAYNREFIRQDLMRAVYDSYWRVDNLKTVADRKQKEIEEIRRKHRERMTELKEEQRHTVRDLKEKRRADIAAVRKEYQEKNRKQLDAMRERHKESRERANESRSAAHQRQSVEKAAKSLMDMLSKPSKETHVPMALQAPLEKFLNSIDFSSKRALSGGELTIRDVAYTRALQEVKTAIAKQRTALEGDADGTFSLDVPRDFLEQIDEHINLINKATEGLDLTTNRIYEMTSDELKDLAFILKTINRAIRDIDRLHMAGAKARVSELAKSTVWEMGRRKAVKTEDGGEAMWANYTPTFAFERMGKAATQILDGLKTGQAKLARTAAAVIKFSEETYTGKEVKAWENEVHEVTLGSGETVKMTTAQIMSFYCLSRREQAKGHLTGGGIRMGNIGEGRKTIRQTDHFRLTQEDIAKINGLLTDRQIEVANKLQRYMADVGGRLGNEISMARWDYMEMTDRDYFPIRSDSDIHDARNPDQDKTNLWALLNKSFTKQVTKGANDAMIVSSIFDVFADHMSDMAEYNAFALPLVDAMKWYNYRESTKYESGHVKTVGVKKALTDKLGTAAGKYFIDLMTDINSSQKAGRFENFFGKLLSRSKAASVGWNLRVAIQQPTAILRASVYLDPMSLVKGTVKKGMKASIEEMKKYSGIALWKSLGYYDLNISRGIRDQIKGDTTVLDQINDAGMWLPGKMDEVTWSRIWESCKVQVAKEQKLSGERLLEETAKLFEDVVYHTQVADSVLTRSSLMRSKSQTVKELTSFMAEPTLSVNLLLNAFQDYREGVSKSDKVKRTMKILFCGYVLSAVANAVFTAFADAARDDDEYEGYWDKFFQALLGEKFYDGNLFAELNPLEKIAFVRDVLSLLQGYEGAKNPFVELAESGIKLVQNIVKFFQGKGSLTVYGLIYQSLQVLGGFTGAAPANLLREASTIWNWTFGKWNNMPLHRYKTDPKSQIRDAYKSGALKKSEAREALMAAGISVTDAYWIIKDWDAGESTGRYDDVYKAALAGDDIGAAVAELVEHGEKTEKEVLSQLKSQIGTWYTDPESDTRIDRQEAEKMLRQYFDLDDKEIEEQLLLWDMKVETGFSLDGLKQKFLDDAVSAEDAVRYLMEYGGKDQTEAQERVDDWAFELEHGYSYDDIRQTYLDEEITADEAKSVMMEVAGKTEEEADYSLKLWDHEKEAKWRYEDRASLYKDGKITKEQLVDALIDVGEYDRKDAEYQVEVYEWEKAGLDGATIKRVQKWHEYCEKAGVTKEQFLKIQKFSSDTKNDVDANGKTINFSAMKKVMAEINRLPLSASQKDALAKSLGWSDKNIRKYKPW